MAARAYVSVGILLVCLFAPVLAGAAELDELFRRATTLKLKSPKLQTLQGFTEYRLWKAVGLKGEARFLRVEGEIPGGTAVVWLQRKKEKDTVKVPFDDLDTPSKQNVRYIVSLMGEVEAACREVEQRQGSQKPAPAAPAPAAAPGGDKPASELPTPVVRLLDKATFDVATGLRDPERLQREIAEALQGRETLDLAALIGRLQVQLRTPDLRGLYPRWLHEQQDKLLGEFKQTRSWQDASGTHATEAKLVAVSAATATLAKLDGTRVPVPLPRLGRASLSHIWALATCGVLLADLKPAEPDGPRVAQIARYCEAIEPNVEAPRDLRSTARAWLERARPRLWGELQARYLGSGKHADGSAWVALETAEGQRVFFLTDDLPPVCRSTVKQLESSGERILRTGAKYAGPQDTLLAQAAAANKPKPAEPEEVPAPAERPDPAATPEEPAQPAAPDEPPPMAGDGAKPAEESAPTEAQRQTLQTRVDTALAEGTKLLPAKLREAINVGAGAEAEAQAARASYWKSLGFAKAGWETRKLPVDHKYAELSEDHRKALDLGAHLVEKLLVWEKAEPTLQHYFLGLEGQGELRDLTLEMTLQFLRQFGDETIFLGLPHETIASRAAERLQKAFQAHGWRPRDESGKPAPPAPAPDDENPFRPE